MNGYLSAAEQSSDAVGGVVGWVTGLMETMGAPGAGLAVALENLFPPLPSEVFLPLAGFTASRGGMSLAAALFWTTLGSVVGAVVLYYVGVVLGRDRIRAIARRMPLVKLSDVDKTEAWFLRHGVKAVFFGRMIPIFRSLISVPAGIERMSMATFLVFTTFGSLIWNSALVLAGYLLGDNWHVVEAYVGVLSKVVLVIVVLGIVFFVGSRLVKARRAKREPRDPGDEETQVIPRVR